MEDDIMRQIYRTIITALESTLDGIGSVLDADARKEIIRLGIIDKGDFLGNAGYLVQKNSEGMTLRVGSNVRHEPFVLGGKVPSGTPLEPLKAWVERKNLAWVDKKTGTPLKVEQMAKLIFWKIKHHGIPARNVYETVLQNKEAWIFDQLNGIDVRL